MISSYLRVLHSFPTRRSSDLHRVGADELGARCGLRSGAQGGGQVAPAGGAARKAHLFAAQEAAREPRSEEHTSELQSHVNLVCRLLLEKINAIYYVLFACFHL